MTLREGEQPVPARCLSCKVLHSVEMKARDHAQDVTGPLGYGTHTLPREFWTSGPRKTEAKQP